jgi:DNA sulfur modification protein DndE
MKPPVETVRISSRGREILIKVKRKTGIERWNEICRLALCRSLANPSKPPKNSKVWDSAIEIEWKTFAGELGPDFAALIRLRAAKDKIDPTKKDLIADYFRAHLERGIASLQNTTGLESYLCFAEDDERI